MLSNRLLVQSFRLEYLDGASLVHIPSVDGSQDSNVLPPNTNFSKTNCPWRWLPERGVRAEDGVDLGSLAAASVPADPQTPRSMSFSLEAAWRPVIRNGLGGELANSFLAIAACEPGEVVERDVLAWHFAVERDPRCCR